MKVIMDNRFSNQASEEQRIKQNMFSAPDEMRLRLYASLDRLDERAAQTYALVARSREMIERSRELLERQI
jgi:hypothetical protein